MNYNSEMRRRNDFPESQIGYPERNDVRDPLYEMERIHVDLETLELTRTSADKIDREIKEQSTFCHQ